MMIVALTVAQVDRLIEILARLIEHVPALLGLCGTAFLIIRQMLNKRDLDKKIEVNTALTAEVKAVAVESKEEAKAAFTEANNVNVKLASIGIQTKPQLGDSAENPMHTTTP